MGVSFPQFILLISFSIAVIFAVGNIHPNHFELMNPKRVDFVKLTRAHPESIHEVIIALDPKNLVSIISSRKNNLFLFIVLVQTNPRMFWKKWFWTEVTWKVKTMASG